jgi:outer membrane protein
MKPNPTMQWKLLCRCLSPLLSAALLAVLLAVPAEAKGLEGLKIGVVNVNQALNQSAAGERSKSILLASKSQLENELKAKEDDLKKKRDDLQNNIMLTKDARDAKEQELRTQETQLRKDVEDAQRELQAKERTLTESIFVELRTVINQIAKEEHYDLVLEQNAANVILYSSTKFDDLTDKVIERYNQFNAHAPAAKESPGASSGSGAGAGAAGAPGGTGTTAKSKKK